VVVAAVALPNASEASERLPRYLFSANPGTKKRKKKKKKKNEGPLQGAFFASLREPVP
jgi:hypothetical protein